MCILGICMIAAIIFACTKGSSNMNNNNTGGNSNTVSIMNMAFSNTSLNITAGTKVTWTNNDAVAHTVTADDASFDSGDIGPGASYSRTFSTAGTINYHCKIHPMMTAAVIVN